MCQNAKINKKNDLKSLWLRSHPQLYAATVHAFHTFCAFYIHKYNMQAFSNEAAKYNSCIGLALFSTCTISMLDFMQKLRFHGFSNMTTIHTLMNRGYRIKFIITIMKIHVTDLKVL